MKKYLAVMLCVLFSTVVFCSGVALAQGASFAFVNFQQFAQKSKRFAAAQQKLRQEVARKQTKLQKKQEKLRGLQEALQKQRPMLRPERQDAMIKQIGILEMELKLANQRAKQWLQNEQREKMETMRRDIRKIIESIRKQRKITLIFDSMGLLGADPRLDITDEIVAKYDAQAPSKPAARTPRPRTGAPAAAKRKPSTAPKPRAKPKDKK
jgi:Skp family chaperone for outer membrane proteins